MVKIKKKTNKNCCNKAALAVLSTLSVVLIVVMAACLICMGAKNAELSRFSKWMAYGFAYDNCSIVVPEDGKHYFCMLYDYNAEADSPYLRYYYAEDDPESDEIIGDVWYNLTVYFDPVDPNEFDDPEAYKDSYWRRVEYSDETIPLESLFIFE